MELIRGCVAYDERSFLSVIETLSDERKWQEVSDEAYEQAQELTWELTLEPLDQALRDPSRRYLTPYMRAMIENGPQP
jgi:hypothetical protein